MPIRSDPGWMLLAQMCSLYFLLELVEKQGEIGGIGFDLTKHVAFLEHEIDLATLTSLCSIRSTLFSERSSPTKPRRYGRLCCL